MSVFEIIVFLLAIVYGSFILHIVIDAIKMPCVIIAEYGKKIKDRRKI